MALYGDSSRSLFDGGSLAEHVYKGIWIDYNSIGSAHRKWTVTNIDALIVFAAFTTLVTFTQARAWIIILHCGAKTPGLQTQVSRDLRQGEALAALSTFLCRRLKIWVDRPSATGPRTPVPDMSTARGDFYQGPKLPQFGILAALNGLLFLIIGIAVPVWASEGALGAPLVISASTARCIESPLYSPSGMHIPTAADSIFHECSLGTAGHCDQDYSIPYDKIQTEQLSRCPFGQPYTRPMTAGLVSASKPEAIEEDAANKAQTILKAENICSERASPIQITHWNLTARDFGVNSRHSFQMSHRLTCSPILLDKFLFNLGNTTAVVIDRDDIWSALATSIEQEAEDRENEIPTRLMLWGMNFMSLVTHNGPNDKYPEERSGRLVWGVGGPRDVLVKPPVDMMLDALNPPDNYGKLREGPLVDEERRAFLVIHRPGRVAYSSPVDDPFFSAHDVIGGYNNTFYIPDFEATALGCLEEYKVCASGGGMCTDWGDPELRIGDLLRYLRATPPAGKNPAGKNGTEAAEELRYLYALLASLISVQRYLSPRSVAGVYSLLSEAKYDSWFRRSIKLQSSTDQWTIEVRRWFLTAYLESILYFKDAARLNLLQSQEGKPLLCGQVKFRDSDHINIFLLRFLFISICLCTIWGLSFLTTLKTDTWLRIAQLRRRVASFAIRGFFWVIGLRRFAYCWFRQLRVPCWSLFMCGSLRRRRPDPNTPMDIELHLPSLERGLAVDDVYGSQDLVSQYSLYDNTL